MHSRRERGGRRRRATRALAAAGVGLPALLGAACDPNGAGATAPTEPPPATVEVVRVEPRPLRDVVPFSGQLEAEHSVLVKPETEGVVESVEFAEGQRVEEGAVLFRLRDDEQEARLREAQANLALAREVHQRTQQLRSRDITSRAQADRAEAELSVAKARVDLARVELERMRVRAPFDGVLGVRMVDPGDRVTEDDALVRIDATERLQLLFAIPEAGSAQARPGIPVEATVAAHPGEAFPGEIFFVSPTVDPATRRLLLKAWIPNPEGRLRPGMFVNVDVEVASKESALVVPESALVHDRRGAFVWRVNEEEQAERAPVQVGLRKAGQVEIELGLQPGDRVVSAGTHKVSEGRPVRVAPAPTGQARGGEARPDGEGT